LKRRYYLRLILVAATAIVLLYLSRETWLAWPALLLIDGQPPEKAEAIVVLAGDWTGGRVLKAAGLVRDGYAPLAYLSGPTAQYGRNEGQLALEFAVSKGFPESSFRIIFGRADSTRQEAGVIWPHLQRQGIRRFLIVTSELHTGRAARVYRSVVKGAAFSMVAAPSPGFDAKFWWKRREGRKALFFEWSKTVADLLGM